MSLSFIIFTIFTPCCIYCLCWVIAYCNILSYKLPISDIFFFINAGKVFIIWSGMIVPYYKFRCTLHCKFLQIIIISKSISPICFFFCIGFIPTPGIVITRSHLIYHVKDCPGFRLAILYWDVDRDDFFCCICFIWNCHKKAHAQEKWK